MSALLIGLGLPGCGDEPNTTTTTTTTGSGGDTGGTGGTGGNTGGTGGTGGNTGGSGGSGGSSSGGSGPGEIAVEAIAEAPGALDSTPDSTGLFIYFTATRNGDAGVFKVSGSGGPVSDLLVGAPLVAPIGIAIDTTDTSLFVADAGFNSLPDDPANPVGAIIKLGTNAGGQAAPLDGTAGFKPRGLDIVKGAQGDVLTFTGVNPADGAAGVFSVATTGGVVSTVATGAPLSDPSGVAVGKFKTFVTDALASDGRLASLLVIENGVAKTVLPSIGVGYPAGVALSPDELTVYVSGIDVDTGRDVVLIVDVITATVTPYSGMGIDQNVDAAGLHRARDANIFSWADSTAGAKGGTIYKVSFK